ncbi:MAG: hypothetical protein IPM23_04715 [Candidatus Melainabacteria bacterium]|nr:hypothetical protein [Candidatus Melainabacteria bacterium]
MSANSENRRETGDSGAREMLRDASEGRSISSQYNALSPQEQRAALTDMRNLQRADTTGFGNVELIDGNGDGILDDARSTDRAGGKTDVYDPAAARVLSPREISGDANLREADSILRSASQGQDVFGKIQRSHNPNLLDDLRAVQASKPQYGNVELIDSNGDGQIDDIKTLKAGRDGSKQELDVYKTPADRERERIEARTRQAVQNGERIILDEVLNRGKRNGSAGERIGREGRRVIGDILKDMGKGK